MMNRSRYLGRTADSTDRSILAELAKNGRVTVRDIAQAIGLSAPSVAERIRRMEDTGVIGGYTITIDAQALGMGVSAHIRLRPVPGEIKRIEAMLGDAPEVVEADRVTGDDCFYAKVIVAGMRELEAVLDRFLPYAVTSAAVIQSSTVKRRIPRI